MAAIQQFSLSDAIQRYPVCQSRRGKYKQWVFYYNEQYVVKGPYSQELVSKILQRSEKFKTWDMKNIIYPLSVSNMVDYIPNSVSKNTAKNGYFLWMNNIGSRPVICKWHQESWDPYVSYQVLTSPNIKTLLDVFEEKETWFFSQLGEIIYSLIGMKLMGVGDTGLYNIICNTETMQVYIIDYDQDKTEFIGREDFYFSSAIKAKLRDTWLHMARPYYPMIIERLRKLAESEPFYAPQIENCIIALTNGSLTAQVSTTGNIIPAHIVQSDVVQNTGSPNATRISLGHMGKMEYKSMFRAIGFSGYKIDVLKSGLQKYIRRNVAEKAILSFIEAYRIGDLPGGDGVRTNICNRLAVIAAEDISIANPGLALNIIHTVLKRSKGSASTSNDVCNFCACIQAAANSYKTRISSHAYYCFGNPKGMQEIIKEGVLIETFVDEIRPALNWKRTDPAEIRQYAEMFAKRLSERNYSADNLVIVLSKSL